MARRKTREEWLEEASEVLAKVEGFNAAHPHSTWAELEGAVDGALAGWRRGLLEASVRERALADFRGGAERPRPVPIVGCPCRRTASRRGR